jgi:hypothetical protein
MLKPKARLKFKAASRNLALGARLAKISHGKARFYETEEVFNDLLNKTSKSKETRNKARVHTIRESALANVTETAAGVTSRVIGLPKPVSTAHTSKLDNAIKKVMAAESNTCRTKEALKKKGK